MQRRLQVSRDRIEHDLAQSAQRRFFSAAFLAQFQVVSTLMQRYMKGRTIDLGCGTIPFKSIASDQISVYHTLDLQPRGTDTTYVGDVQDMHMIRDSSYDSAICLEVLEHVPDPQRAVGEIQRILRPGGVAIISVPHLSRLHDVPHDYYRFTKYGIRHLLETSGFVVLEIREKGGLVSFLAHQVSTLLLSAAWPLPGLRQIVWFLNRWFVTYPCSWIDKATSRSGIFALGYVVAAQKPLSDIQLAGREET